MTWRRKSPRQTETVNEKGNTPHLTSENFVQDAEEIARDGRAASF